MKKYLLGFLLFTQSGSAQVPFEKIVNANFYRNNQDDRNIIVIEHAGTNYLFAGQYYDANNDDFAYLIYTDTAGTMLWNKIITDTGNTSYFNIHALAEDPGSGFLAVGAFVDTFNVSPFKAHILKIDFAGNILWSKKIEAPPTGNECFGKSIMRTSDGNFLITGRYNVNNPAYTEEIFIIKISGSGNVILNKNYFTQNGSYQDIGRPLETSSGYIFPVYSSYPANKMILLKTDFNGSITVAKSYDPGIIYDPVAVYPYPNNQLAFIFENTYPTGTDLFHVLITDTSGVFQSARKMTTDYMAHASIKQTDDGGFILCGGEEISAHRSALAKLDVNLDQQWGNFYQITSGSKLWDVTETPDGGFISIGVCDYSVVLFAGAPQVDLVLLRTDENGSIACDMDTFSVMSTPVTFDDSIYTYFNSGSGLPVSNLTMTSSSAYHDSLLCFGVGINEPGNNELVFEIYPNPATSEFTVYGLQFPVEKSEVKIFDVLGKEIYSQSLVTTNTKLKAVNWSNGIYFVQLKSENKIATRKLVIQH